jgi:uncharacterized phage protein (TIGR01671 family)
MNREIKFRAWDGREMFHVHSAMFRGNGRMECLFEHAETKEGKDVVRMISDDAIVMQFTGLKDKNGKEIYEGDIIEFKKGTEGLWAGQAGMKEVKYPFLCGNSDLGEVIGNIYENPELTQSHE